MPDKKISQMTAAVEVANADILPIVKGMSPPNYYASKALLLQNAAGEDIYLGAGGSFNSFWVDPNGNGAFNTTPGTTFQLGNSAGDEFIWDDAVGLTIAVITQISFSTLDGQLFQMATGNPMLVQSPFGVVVTYVAGNPLNWSGDPLDMNTAIDRLAAAVAGLLGVPIP